MPTLVPFGDFVLDLESRELRRGAEPLKLSPKALQLLEILATSGPKAFSKAELQDRLWPGTFVVEKNLANLVTEIREVLGDTPSEQRFIRTVPRFGYAFRDQAPAAAPENAVPAAKVGPPVLALVAGLLCVAAAVAGFWWLAGRPASTKTTIKLAVLPLENLTGDPDQDYLCDGVTEELIAQLGSADPNALKVIARTSAMHYRNTTKRADEIGRELDVRYLLETSLRRVGNRVRVTAQLVSTATQEHVWSEQYEHHFSDALALQREIADRVVRGTTSSLGVVGRSAVTERLPGNSAAYEHYLRGRHHLQKETKDGLLKAREHLQKAVALESGYARAYSGLAEAYLALGEVAVMPIAESHALGRDAALTALKLEDSLAEAHRSLAVINGQHYWQWADADESFKRALQLAPNDVTTLRMYSFFLAYTGRPAQGLPIAELASTLDPVSTPARLNLGVVLYIGGRANEAVRRLEETLELNEHFGFARAILGLAYASQGLHDKAVAELAQARALTGNRPDVVAMHGFALGRAGRRREALGTLDDIRRLTNPQAPPPFQMAMVYIGFEDWDRAFEWLDKAVDGRAWEVPLVKSDPAFERLRKDARFPKLLARVGLPE